MLRSNVRAALVDEPLEHTLTPHLHDPRWPSFVSKLMALNVTYTGVHHIPPKVDALRTAFGVAPRAVRPVRAEPPGARVGRSSGGVRPRIGAKIWLLVTLKAWLRTVYRG